MNNLQKLHFGSLSVEPIVEIAHKMMPKTFLFETLTKDEASANANWLGSEHICQNSLNLGLAFRSYLIRVHGLNILVDTCNGNHKQRIGADWQHDLRSQAFLQNLHLAGLQPSDIHIVICTHLHGDHVGWNTRLENGKWVPTFPNARYIMSKIEYEMLLGLFSPDDPTALNRGAFADSVLPVVEADLAEFVSGDMSVVRELEEHVTLMPTPGHTIGHMCVRATTNREDIVVAGDALHHAIQLDLPQMVMRADADPDKAKKSRLQLLEHCVAENSWLCANHIPLNPFNKVVAHKDVFRFQGWLAS